MSKNPNSSPLMALHAPWDHNDNVIWLASTIRLLRNIEKFKFPQKLEVERKVHIMQLTSKSFMGSASLKSPFLLKAEDITPSEKEFLIEHFLLFEGFQEARAGAGFALDETGEIIAIFNVKEHLQLQYTDASGDLEAGWSKIINFENEISKSLTFAFSPKFGFLTADPFHCGTGLIVSAYLHVPALIHTHQLTDHMEKGKMEGVISSGLQGNPDDLVGDILMLRNVYTLGINEESILASIRNSILHVVMAEKGVRNQIKSEKMASFKDNISRSLGLLKFSYQLDAQEALSAISFLKLGIELGWVKGMSVVEVNTLFFESRRSHLTYLLSEKSPSEDITFKRAEYLRKRTASVTLEF